MGAILGPDQVKKVNATYPALVMHIKSLLEKDHSGVGLMRVHSLVESFDSDEMARIFCDLSFISPREKLALVRAAVYELVAKEPALFIAPEVSVFPQTNIVKEMTNEAPKVFTPPPFKLNVNKTEAFHGKAPADTPAPAPIVTSTHTPKVSAQLEAGAEQSSAHQAKLDAAVAKLREASEPTPTEE